MPIIEKHGDFFTQQKVFSHFKFISYDDVERQYTSISHGKFGLIKQMHIESLLKKYEANK